MVVGGVKIVEPGTSKHGMIRLYNWAFQEMGVSKVGVKKVGNGEDC